MFGEGNNPYPATPQLPSLEQNHSQCGGLWTVKKRAQTMKVAIVDDSLLIRRMLRELLMIIPGVEITGETGNAAAADSMIRRAQPDVVILDINLPGGDGIELLRRVKETQPGLNVIMFTSYCSPEHRKRCQEAGASLFFDKTCQISVLMDAIRRMAETKQRSRVNCPNS